MFFVAFAHQPLQLRASVDSESLAAEFMLPDGTFPVICMDSSREINDKTDDSRHLHVADCDACRLSSNFICARPAPSSGMPLHLALAHGQVLPEQIISRILYPPAAPPRAPPLA